MSTIANLESPLLSSTDAATVLELRHLIYTTQHEDPKDRALFLDAAAKSLLLFRPFLASFAIDPTIGQTPFLLRTRLQANDRAMNTPPSNLHKELVNFTIEIISRRVRLAQAHAHAALDQHQNAHASIPVANNTADTNAVFLVSPSSQDSDSDSVLKPEPIRPPGIPAPSSLRTNNSPENSSISITSVRARHPSLPLKPQGGRPVFDRNPCSSHTSTHTRKSSHGRGRRGRSSRARAEGIAQPAAYATPFQYRVPASNPSWGNHSGSKSSDCSGGPSAVQLREQFRHLERQIHQLLHAERDREERLSRTFGHRQAN